MNSAETAGSEHNVRVIDHHDFPALARELEERGETLGRISTDLDRRQVLAVRVGRLRDAEGVLLGHCAKKVGLRAISIKSGALLLGPSRSFADLAQALASDHGSLGGLAEEIASETRRFGMNTFTVPLPGREALALGSRTLVMGILNVTPDSFSDGGRHADSDTAVARGIAMCEEGADILDVGGESTRPGATPVDPAEEKARILPVIERLAAAVPVPISIDTRRGATAREAIQAGACIVNDVSGLADPLMAAVVAKSGAAVILMHMRGTPADMREHAEYDDVVREVAAELTERVSRALDTGVDASGVMVDPGIGFAKTADQSRELIRRLGELRGLGRPLVIGPSRKSFLASIEETSPDDRLELGLGAVGACVANGAHVVRVHDVRPTVRFIHSFQALSATIPPTRCRPMPKTS